MSGSDQERLGAISPWKKSERCCAGHESYVSNGGYLLRPPIGHICGIDMVEARVTLQNEDVLEPGMAVIIHPTLFTLDGRNSFFWEKLIWVKSDGYERLNQSTDELLTI